MQALIGCTGFVGSWLAGTDSFDFQINRSNLESLQGAQLDRIVCAGLPATKWIANRNPAEDLANVQRLEGILKTVRASKFTLISTIDVYPLMTSADEDFDCEQHPNHSYGAHRLRFERFVRESFPQVHVVRLPAMFGPGLKKNVIYDLLHDNQLEAIHPESRFQWYPLTRLADDLRVIEAEQLPLVNLFTEPLATGAVITKLFPGKTVGRSAGNPVHYDLHTRHGRLFGGDGRYMMRADAAMSALHKFVHDQQTMQ